MMVWKPRRISRTPSASRSTQDATECAAEASDWVAHADLLVLGGEIEIRHQ
jgi:hypothetical protein